MRNFSLRDIFRQYKINQEKIGDVSRLFDHFLREFLVSAHAEGLNAPDSFPLSASNRLTFHIDSVETEETATMESLAVDVMAEGTARVIAYWPGFVAADGRGYEERIVHFTTAETASEVTAKVLSVMADLSQSNISSAISAYVQDATSAMIIDINKNPK